MVLRGRVLHLLVAAQVGREVLLQVVQGDMVVLLQVVQEGKVGLRQAVQWDMEAFHWVVQGGKVVHLLVVQQGRVQICLRKSKIHKYRYLQGCNFRLKGEGTKKCPFSRVQRCYLFSLALLLGSMLIPPSTTLLFARSLARSTLVLHACSAFAL